MDRLPQSDLRLFYVLSTCGLHVHIGRCALGNTYERQEDVISRILFFFESHWNELFRFSRRSEESVEHWAARHGYEDRPKEILEKAKKSSKGRYEVCVYAKLPKGFSIPTPVGNYSPDWAIAFHKGKVKHIFFVAETKKEIKYVLETNNRIEIFQDQYLSHQG